MTDDRDRWPLTRAELARRYGVHLSAITRALTVAESARTRDPRRPAPPQPVNPGEYLLRWLPAEFDPWWSARARPGRPAGT